ncbi:MAG TPA: bifunctional phosphopantothenoylcysteine decarboxylase/phosphopantothenate--cysteine ligase CoaBC [Streptosporangiaceae bacterium]|jgi:phosphopantothenoylcysteine decarboxylase/phosphopantothenate--cysteine ligase
MRVVLGVAAGIAAYKSCELLRLLTESGHSVRVVPTPDALNFVGAATWAALSGQPVTTTPWTDVDQVPHVRIGQQAELVLVAPATADLLARAAAGMSGDLLTAVLLTARCPVVFAPAMHTEMWQHPATQANVATLRERGAIVIDPAAGRLTGADTGPGRLPDPAALFAVAERVLARGAGALTPDLVGRHVVISAGGTREDIDPVRFLGSYSTGRPGYALAVTAASRGARVTLVAAGTGLASTGLASTGLASTDPAGATVIRVTSAAELREQMLTAASGADAVVMAAAVADFRPASRSPFKLKKTQQPPEPIELAENPDILAELVTARNAAASPAGQVIVGFAAATGDLLANGRAKLAAKGCDLLVVNQADDGLGLGASGSEAVVLHSGGPEVTVPRGPKAVLADVIWDLVAAQWRSS